MKRLLFTTLAVILLGGLLITGCGEEEEKPPTPTGLKTGGTLRVLQIGSPSNLSYIPEQNMTDETIAKSYAETLIYWSGSGEFKPELAKSWEIDEVNKTLTFYLEEGVKFHDGTPFNAEVVRWNVQLLIDNKRLANGQYVDSIEVVDDYTFRYHLNALFTPQMMLHSYGYNLITMFSPTAFKQNGKEWAISHFVSTGPFTFESFERDVSLKIVRFDDYWRGDPYPYLDAIEWTFVADSTIASAKMQAGEADACSGLPLKESTDLENLGFTLISQLGGFYTDIIPDNKTEGSYYQDKKVREAIEYAIDRDALAAALGFGKLKAVKRLGPEGTQGYDPNYQPREYNPQKAMELLEEAGYPNGFKTTILAMQGSSDLAQGIQEFLAEVNIEAEIDIADAGRFMGAIYANGWNGGLLLLSVPVDPEFAIGWFVHFGPQPIFPYVSLQWPDGYRELMEKVRLAPDIETMHEATKEMMTFASENAVIIPLYSTLTFYVTTDYVRTDRYKDHFMVWHTYKDWLDK